MASASLPSRSRQARKGATFRPHRTHVQWVSVAAAACFALLGPPACTPNISAGKWTCSEDGGTTIVPASDAAIDYGWSTGFESKFCDYAPPSGRCYSSGPGASYELVTAPAPVHRGHFAAAFSVESGRDVHTRCYRQGALPQAAYFAAWYYLPAYATNTGNWNLFHFRGGDDVDHTQGMLDVSLESANGNLQLALFGMNHARISGSAPAPNVPIEKWFQIAVYVKRAPEATGEVALFQDGNELLRVKNVATDDSPLARWYVGNLADGLSPANYTLFVDDITISEQLIYEK